MTISRSSADMIAKTVGAPYPRVPNGAGPMSTLVQSALRRGQARSSGTPCATLLSVQEQEPMRLPRSLCTALALLPTLALAKSHDAFDTFFAYCVEKGPRYEAMVALARQERWTPAETAPLLQLAPVGDVSAASGWRLAASELNGEAVIVVTEGMLQGRPIETCTMALPMIHQEAFRRRFFERTDAERISENREGPEIASVYLVISKGRKQLVRLVVSKGEADALAPMVVSSIAEK